MPYRTTAATAYKRLNRLNATWSTRGELLKGKAAGKTFRGKDSYRWLPGKKFLLHSWDIQMPDGHKQGIEVFGFDKKTGEVTAHSFDSDGNATRMVIDLKKDTYRFLNNVMRFTGHFNDDDTQITGLWELKGRKRWEPWMRINLSRSSALTTASSVI